MADSKITALAALTAADPVNDMFPIVDVSDTSMAASGTTKRISANNILSSSPTASGALTVTGLVTAGSATITGALGVNGAASFNGGALASYLNGLLFFGSSGNIVNIFAQSSGIALKNNSGSANLLLADNSGVFTFGDGAGGTRMTLNSTGLGVGVVPYVSWPATSKALQLGASSSIEGRTNDGSRTAVYTNAVWNGTNLIYQNTADASYYLQSSSVHSWYTAPSGTAGNAITFTQAMTLDASGNLLVGTTTNTNGSRVFARGTGGLTTLAIQSSTGDTANPGLLVGKFDNDSTTSQILVRFTVNNNSAGSGQINANGASQAAFGSFSDSRLKENILSLPSQLANILSLRPVEFDYKNGSGHQIGFVAQEMQEVYSDAVGEQNGFLTVTGWSKTEARLVSAIKELAAKVQALEAKLA